MRHIKFRGLRTDGKGWVYGVPICISKIEEEPEDSINVACIVTGCEWNGVFGFMSIPIELVIEVIPESVGQFTGLHDKNGTEIYEGDMLKHTISFVIGEGRQPYIYYDKVVYSGGGFKTVRVDDENRGLGYLENYVGHTIEIIGNIHTNINSK